MISGMDSRSYADFDLVIEQQGDHYRARVVGSPAGQAAVEFDSLFSPLELENFVLRMGRPQRGMRRIDSSELGTIKTFGTRLFRTVFSDEVYACYLRSLDDVLQQDKGLRIRLRIDVPAFHDLPWEYLYNRHVDQFLALSKDTPIVRYMDLPYGTQALPVKAPIKILVMICSPAEYPSLDVEEEWRNLNRALQPLTDRGQVLLARLEEPTLSALQQRLRREPAHIFHFIGHGKYFEQQQDGMLLLEDGTGRGRPTSGQQLGAILHDHHTLRLVVLNACEGARTSAEDPYTGVAQTLVRQGIPAVLAMQFEIFENAAITLAREFYGAIADGYAVDAALAEARKAIFAGGNDVEWGTPVLFMRIPNGVLFRPETATEKATRLASEQRAAEKAAREVAEREAREKRAKEQRDCLLTGLYDQAKSQIQQQDWRAAVHSLAQIRRLEPAYRDVPALLEQAEAERERAARVADLLSQGRDMSQNRDWLEAVSVLQQLSILAPGHEEGQQLLANARAQLKQEQERQELLAHLASLYDRARASLAAGDWAPAIDLFEKIHEMEPGFRDTEQLMKQVQSEKERGEELAGLLVRGRQHLSKREWRASAQVLGQALQLDPENGEAREMLNRVERAEQANALFETAQEDLQAGRLHESITGLEAVLQLESGYTGAARLLADARTELRHREEEELRQASKATEPPPMPPMPLTFPEEIKRSRPAAAPEDTKPLSRPEDLPK